MSEHTQNTSSSSEVQQVNDVSLKSPSQSPHSPTPHKSDTHNSVLELVKLILLAILIVAPIRLFVAQPFVVSGASMEDTFQHGQYLIVDQLSYHFNEPERGDVIIFRFPLEQSKFFIKRVIGLPGETVILQGKAVIIVNSEHPEGFVLDETYLSPDNLESESGTVTLSRGEYFVMGDNRKESSDSRTWGVLEDEYIIGKAFVRLFPLTEASLLPGQ